MGQAEITDVELAASPPTLPDADSRAETALTQALEFCRQKMSLAQHAAVVDCLRRGDHSARGYFHYALAGQVGECLGELDADVRAVYLFDYAATAEDACFGKAKLPPLLHLIVWAQRRTAALQSLTAVLDRALVQRCAELVGLPELGHLLDVQVVDDADVENRVGYGALLSSIHNPPVQVWRR